MNFMSSVIIFLLVCCSLIAHPVTWKDGKVFQVQSFNHAVVCQSHYSVNSMHALGLTHLYQKKIDKSYMFFHNNWLLKRWSDAAFQANIYLLSGVGLKLENSSLPSFISMQADWETRNNYVYFKAEQQYLNRAYTLLRFRYGFSPYEGSFNDWHTWILVQADDFVDNAEHHVQLLPVLRFFRHQFLFEFGFDFNKNGFA